jgi:valyl-tRNA synthetase
MMMMGLHFMHEAPFHTVYIHALVRDEKGQKMSKSKGNVIDPLDLIDQYGADALRFTLAAMAAQGRDIKLSTQRVEGYRNFTTKLWNAARFCEMQGCVRDPAFSPTAARLALNLWILHELQEASETVSKAIEDYRFNDAAGALYAFVWNTFCDWYLELAKPVLGGTDELAQAETRATAAFVLDGILALLHPFMPFVTEELWSKTGARSDLLMSSQWPAYPEMQNPSSSSELDWVIRLISAIRSVRAEMNVPAGAKIPCVLVGAQPETIARAKSWETEILRLARLSGLTAADSVPKGSAQIVLGEAVAALPLEGVIDFAAERARLAKELEKTDKDIAGIETRLGNPGFVAKAPEEVIEEAKERKETLALRRGKILEALERLGV